tara:strand:+ start:3752 stop:5413 length:1662 start_codon:yes stop_codon:yes gene_type:complete
MQFKKFSEIKVFLILIAITLLIFSRYNGNYHSDYKYVWLFLDGGLINDIYENKSIYLKTSIVYPLINFFNLNLDNDIVGLFFHIMLCIFAGIYLYKILRKVIPDLSVEETFFLIFALSNLDSMIVNTAKSGWIGHHTMVPSQFGLSFFFFYFWHVINKNKLALSILSIIFILISPRIAWLPCTCAFFYLLLPNYKIKNIIWSVPSLFLVLIYSYLNFDFESIETKKILFLRAIDREQDEIAFHLQSNYYLILITLSFFIYYYLIKFTKMEFRNFYIVILFVTIFTFISGFFYGLYGEFIYPDPKIIALSPVRAMYVYQIFFVISYFAIIKKKIADKILRYSFFILPFLFCLGLKGKVLILLILFLMIVYNSRYIKRFINSFNIDFSYYFIVFIIMLSINSFQNRLDKLDMFTFNEISHWSTHMGKETNNFKSFFLNLRVCDDFKLYDNIRYKTSANFFSNKSKYFSNSNAHVSFNKELYDEHNRRKQIINRIKSKEIYILKDIKNEKFLYLTSKKEKIKKNLFFLDKPFGKLFFYFPENEILNMKKNCPNLFN